MLTLVNWYLFIHLLIIIIINVENNVVVLLNIFLEKLFFWIL